MASENPYFYFTNLQNEDFYSMNIYSAKQLLFPKLHSISAFEHRLQIKYFSDVWQPIDIGFPICEQCKMTVKIGKKAGLTKIAVRRRAADDSN